MRSLSARWIWDNNALFLMAARWWVLLAEDNEINVLYARPAANRWYEVFM